MRSLYHLSCCPCHSPCLCYCPPCCPCLSAALRRVWTQKGKPHWTWNEMERLMDTGIQNVMRVHHHHRCPLRPSCPSSCSYRTRGSDGGQGRRERLACNRLNWGGLLLAIASPSGSVNWKARKSFESKMGNKGERRNRERETKQKRNYTFGPRPPRGS